MRDAHSDATPMPRRSPRCTPSTGPARTRTSAVLSVGVVAAAMAAFAAPSITSGVQAPVALTAGPAEAPVTSRSATGAQDRLEAMERTARSSRSADRGPLPSDEADLEIRNGAEVQAELPPVPAPEPEVVGTRYATTELNVRAEPDMDSKVVTTLDYADKVSITDVTEDEWRQVVYKDKVRWVKREFLSKSKPDPKPAGPSGAPCASGSGVESGLTANTIAVHRAVCNAFPSISAYGGRRGSGGNHGSGHALDIMVNGANGDAVAAYVRQHAGELGVSEVIWSQRIWTVQRGGEGWRGMSDRGSATANHYDHVHVSTY